MDVHATRRKVVDYAVEVAQENGVCSGEAASSPATNFGATRDRLLARTWIRVLGAGNVLELESARARLSAQTERSVGA